MEFIPYLLRRRKSGSACQEGSKDGDLHGPVEFGWKIVGTVGSTGLDWVASSSNQLNTTHEDTQRRRCLSVSQKFVEDAGSRDVRGRTKRATD
jgi:hypothetical protein